jgi:hypothetical protein
MPDQNGFVTAEECKTVVREAGMRKIDHHRCGICKTMAGYIILRPDDAAVSTGSPDDIEIAFDGVCGCAPTSWSLRPSSWEKFATDFNMQKRPKYVPTCGRDSRPKKQRTR